MRCGRTLCLGIQMETWRLYAYKPDPEKLLVTIVREELSHLVSDLNLFQRLTERTQGAPLHHSPTLCSDCRQRKARVTTSFPSPSPSLKLTPQRTPLPKSSAENLGKLGKGNISPGWLFDLFHLQVIRKCKRSRNLVTWVAGRTILGGRKQ